MMQWTYGMSKLNFKNEPIRINKILINNIQHPITRRSEQKPKKRFEFKIFV